jgi:hypothetical protein
MKKQFINLPEESKIEDVEYWVQKMTEVTSFLHEEYKRNSEKNKSKYSYFGKSKKKKAKERKDYKIFEFAPQSILLNEDLMIKSLEEGYIRFFELEEKLQLSKEFSLRYLNENKFSYYFNIKKEVLLDEEVFIICIKKDAKTYTAIKWERDLYIKYGTKEKALELLDLNSNIYEYFEDKLKDDLDVAKKAAYLNVNNSSFMKKSVSAKIFTDKEISLKLLDSNLDLFIKINNKFRDDEELMTNFIGKRPSLFEFASTRLKNKRGFVEKSLRAYNLLDHISDEFKKDPILMEVHLANCPGSFYELKNFLDVKPLMVNNILKSYHLYEYLRDKEKLDEDYIFAVLNHNDFFRKNENNLTFGYERVNIIKILPEEIQKSLFNELLETYPKNKYENNKELDDELLSFARKKYTNIRLTKNLGVVVGSKTKIKI